MCNICNNTNLLFTSSEWTEEKIANAWEVIQKIATEKYDLTYYPAQIEIVSAEQMLEVYSSVGMPFMYNHWSFGKDFIQNHKAYEKGRMGLAYELIINTNPSIAYLMEDNSMTMQTLVLAHASIGHSSFFKHNYLFKQWTNADAIVGYLKFAKQYVADCERKHGAGNVEEFLDLCHSLKDYGVHKYKKPMKKKKHEAAAQQKARLEYERTSYNELWNSIPKGSQKDIVKNLTGEITYPYDNILYFIEKYSIVLEDWQRELVRIVRKINEYFYPQRQTKVMNEGWASFWHYTLMGDLYEEGFINEGSYLEFIDSHSGVVMQPDYDSPYFSQINPYTLGFSMFMDLKRICENPTEEDQKWFPELCGQEWLPALKDIANNYRDESFILQYLSPKVIRDLKLFCLWDVKGHPRYEISQTHDDEDVIEMRKALASEHEVMHYTPIVEIISCDFNRTFKLVLEHFEDGGMPLDRKTEQWVLDNIGQLWGYPVQMKSKKDPLFKKHGGDPDDLFFDI